MFRCKKDVDRHMQDIFRKLKNENEKYLRSYNIAKLYYQVGDYESAKRYVSSYLEVRRDCPGAHKLLGQALEGLGQKEAALAQYITSLELEARQDDLVLKVCELLTDTDISMDINRVRYWVERADKQFPHHATVFQLKEKMLTLERPNDTGEDLEALIASELSARPSDVHLRVKLLKHYIAKERLDDAYNHAASFEETYSHRNSIVWYQALSELLMRCKESKKFDWSFWIFYISSLERYTALSLKEEGEAMSKSVQEAMEAVFNFDKALMKFKSQNFTNNSSFTENMLSHMWGQLHFHLACLILRKTKREQGSWNEARRLCGPLLLSALQTNPINPSAPWTDHLKDWLRKQVRLWYREGSYRCSQAGHVLQDYGRNDSNQVVDKIDKFCTGTWRERIYQRIFTSAGYQRGKSSSYFANNIAPNPPFRLLSQSELRQYDEVSEEVWPESLHHQLWLGLKSRPHFAQHKEIGPHPNQISHVFRELQFSVYNLHQAAPDSLCRLDIDAFLNAAILCASALLHEEQIGDFLNPDRLPTLPADITKTLCTSAQQKWWSSAYKMYSKQKSVENDIGEIRQELQRGLEVVRCIGNHGLHPVIIVHLARIFQHRAKMLKEKDKEHSDIPPLEARCELYWSIAVPLLDRLHNNQTIRITNSTLFHYQGKGLTDGEIIRALEEGKLLLTQRFLREKQYEQAIDSLQALKCPEASFQQGQIYEMLANEIIGTLARESLTSEMRSQHIIMLSKARNCYYLTLDRLRSPGSNPKHPLNSELSTRITDIENELAKIDPNFSHGDFSRNECDGLSEESYSSAQSNGDNPISIAQMPTVTGLSTSINVLGTPQRNTHRTPKQTSTPCRPQHQDILDLSRSRNEARPSPERLDAQIRQLIYSKDTMNTIMEQNKTILEKIDGLEKGLADIRKEMQRQRPSQPANVNPNPLEEDLYVLGEEDYNDLNYNGAQAGPASIAGNIFTPVHHQALPQWRIGNSPLVHPPAAPFQGYYQGGMPFADPNTQQFYANNFYPMPVLYPNGTKMQENLLQQGLFSSRIPDLMPPANQPLQLPIHKVETPKPDMMTVIPPTSLPMSVIPPPAMPLVQPPVVMSSTSLSTGIPMAAVPGAPIIPAPSMKPAATTTVVKDAPVNKVPPVNVVITTSDILPTTAPPVQQTFSVMIPPQHRLGTTPIASIGGATLPTTTPPPHCYQLSMPSQPTIPTTVNLPALSTTLTTSAPSIAPPITETSRVRAEASPNTSTEVTEVEHDPLPDFAPVIPLPAQVKVTTGEENEQTIYSARAKLFRYVEKEWKERGVGNVKLLKNSEGKIRLLMRRDQVLKICANHFLRPDMELSQVANNDKTWMWVANDFADEQVRLEKLCIKFKTTEDATAFKENFDKAKATVVPSPVKPTAAPKSDDTSDGKDLGKTAEQLTFGTKGVRQKQGVASSATPEATKNAAGTISGLQFGVPAKTQQGATPDSTKGASKGETPKANPFSEFTFGKSTAATPSQQTPCFPFGKQSASVTSPKFAVATTASSTTDSSSTTAKTQVPLSEMFKPAAGSWRCDTCCLSNKAVDNCCVACKTPKVTSPKFSAVTTTSSTTDSSSATTKTQVPLSELFKPAAGSWKCDMCCVSNQAVDNYCVACETPKDPSMPPKPAASLNLVGESAGTTPSFSFGIPPEANKDTSGGFTFRLPTANNKASTDTTEPEAPVKPDTTGAKFVFGMQQKAPAPSAKDAQFTFGSPGKAFGFNFTPKSPGAGEYSEEEVVESDDIEFAPVIPLPDRIEPKTGEEEEEVLYSHRAKLYRYDKSVKEWKERGVGDIKLLKHRESGKLRLVMRRDQILKLCLNHFVLPDLEFTSKDDKSWLWNAPDFSNEEIEYVQFTCRFKTSEIAQEFKKAIDDAKNGQKGSTTAQVKSKGESLDVKSKDKEASVDNDIEIVYEAKPTESESEATERLKLPPNFFAYKQRPDCPGCRGCKEPEVPLFEPSSSANSSTGKIASTSVESKITSPLTIPNVPRITSMSFGNVDQKKDETKKAFNFASALTVQSTPQNKQYVFPPENLSLKICSPSTSVFTSQADSSTAPTSQNIFRTSLTGASPAASPANSSPSIFGGRAANAESPFDTNTISQISNGTSVDIKSPIFKPSSLNIATNSAPPASMFSGNFNQSKATSASTTSPWPTTSASAASTFSFSKAPVFGSNPPQINNDANRPATLTSNSTTPTIFGMSATQPKTQFSNILTFGANANTPSLFGTTTVIKESTPEAKSEENPPDKEQSLSFLSKNNLTFSALAAKSPTVEAFKIDPSFSFAGAGSTVFGGGKQPHSEPTAQAQANNEKHEDNEEDQANDDQEEHDPHFEPVVPMPDIVKVQTGEEDEEKLFCERAKLYRYDSDARQWKERGVGEMKVLYHAERGTYRLLLRREQVHKVVCNFLIAPDVSFTELTLSNCSYAWTGMNHVEGTSSLEQLAIRFKNEDLAKKFKSTIDRVQQTLREMRDKAGGDHASAVDDTDDDEDCDDEKSDEDDDDHAADTEEHEDYREDDDERDEDDESSIVFEKKAKITTKEDGEETGTRLLGYVSIYYIQKSGSYRIVLKANRTDGHDKMISMTIVDDDMQVKLSKKKCVWSAVDYALQHPRRRTLTAIFLTNDIAEEMMKYISKGSEPLKK